jgi:hypothetical protein
MRDAANDDDDLRVLAKSDYLCEIDGGLRLRQGVRTFPKVHHVASEPRPSIEIVVREKIDVFMPHDRTRTFDTKNLEGLSRVTAWSDIPSPNGID